jgi:hypothetical protein
LACSRRLRRGGSWAVARKRQTATEKDGPAGPTAHLHRLDVLRYMSSSVAERAHAHCL